MFWKHRHNAVYKVGTVSPLQGLGIDSLLVHNEDGRKANLWATIGPSDVPGIVLGKELATSLNVKVGGQVTLLTPSGTLSPMGMMPFTPAFLEHRELRAADVKLRGGAR